MSSSPSPSLLASGSCWTSPDPLRAPATAGEMNLRISSFAGPADWLILAVVVLATAAAAWLLYRYRRRTVEMRPPGAPRTVSVDPQPFEHVRLREVVMVAALALAVYLLIPQLADVTGVWSSIKEADWVWAFWALCASALTFVAAAIGLMGAVPQRLPLPTTTAAQLAGAFVNRIVPARMGGMATNLRYLQKRGVDLAVATASIGVQQVSGLVVHVALSAVLLIWAGRNAGDALQALPSGQTVLIGLTVLGALSGLLFLLPWGRRLLRARVLPPLQRSVSGVAAIARSPLKRLELFGGAVFLTSMNIAALALSVYAFGATDVSVVVIGVVFLVGSGVASVAPTPGNLGAVEAALIAGLTTVGVESAVAVPAVFLFRIVTFWLPILPGWLTFVLLQRRGDL
jgi:glycosyltransferase 2 family protein